MSSNNPDKIVAIIPAFNEDATVARVIREVRTYVHEIVVVDDGSHDNTYLESKNAGAVVVRHAHNKGYGTSMEDGFREAVRRDATVMLTFDADGQHRAEDIPSIIQPIIAGETDISIGRRIEGRRHLAESLFALYTKFRFHVPDPLCGLKAYHRKVYTRIGHFETVESIGTQLMIESVARGFRFQVIPVHISERKDNSRFYAQNLRANWKIFKAFWKVLFLKGNG